jgi:hypothetical protein
MPNKTGIRACESCGRDMRPAGTTLDQYPETIGYGRSGSCTTCAARVRRGTALTHHTHLRGGAVIEFIRWRNTRDGWTFDHVSGHYGGRDRAHFRVIVDGAEVLLDRDEWEVCAA